MKSFTLLNHKEIDIIDQLIEDLSAPGGEDLIRNLQKHRRSVVEEYNALARDLEAIKEEDPEFYKLIFWHDIKGRSWSETFNIVYSGLISYDPAHYASKRYRRYMDKHIRL